MRLGQLARKYDVSTQEIIAYLKKIDPSNGSIHPNAKLDELTEQLVAKHFDVLLDSSDVLDFDIPEEETIELTIEAEETVSPDLKIDEANMSEEVLEIDNLPMEQSSSEIAHKEIITTDKLLELLESENQDVDLSKITLIKAPKKELNGLKVLGKIDLPEPKMKASQEKDAKKKTNLKVAPNRISEDEAEKRRLWAKKKKEENEARLEKKRKEKEKEQLKALKEAHYRQKVRITKPKNDKQKTIAIEVSPSVEKEEIQMKPKSILGKFWHWLNT